MVVVGEHVLVGRRVVVQELPRFLQAFELSLSESRLEMDIRDSDVLITCHQFGNLCMNVRDGPQLVMQRPDVVAIGIS